MPIQVHPFLVSRNRTLDYRTVVAPGFMCEAGNANVLARAAGGSLTLSGYATYREIQGNQLNNIALVFRVVKSNQQEIYSNLSSEALTDPFGRDIYWIEGFVIEKEFAYCNFTLEILEEIHKKVLVEFRSFWENSDFFDAPISSLEAIDFYLGSDISRCIVLKRVDPLIVDDEWAFLEEWDTSTTTSTDASHTLPLT